MESMFTSLLGRREKRRAPLTLESLATVSEYPVLDAKALVRLLNVGGKITAIARLAAITPDEFQRLYQPLLDRFIEAAQLQPASIADHHAGLGGLVVHTLEVVETAMSLRRGYLLPTNSDPERIRREELAWTYGVFVASILHDAGKCLTMTRLVPTNGERYSPLAGSITETGATHYRIEFGDPSRMNRNHEFQLRSSIILLCMVPPEGRLLLDVNLRLLEEVSAWLSNRPFEWGTIGRLCQRADQHSVSRNLGPGQPRSQVVGAPTISLGQRLMHAIRGELVRPSLPLNQNGGAGWVTEDRLWLVCKRAMTLARERLQTDGSGNIPFEDDRLPDILLDHGYLIPTPGGRATWHVRIVGDDYDHALTVLCFERQRALHPSRQIAPFAGEIIPITRTELDRHHAVLANGENPPEHTGETAPAAARTDDQTSTDNVPAHIDATPPTDADAFLPPEFEELVTPDAANPPPVEDVPPPLPKPKRGKKKIEKPKYILGTPTTSAAPSSDMAAVTELPSPTSTPVPDTGRNGTDEV
ncbi:MAG: hypothetical protein CSB44_01950 [Gammaproteobacteria bacterium]|nr:MAG: hypothetical protein CSB44_01950 [Gammaproteobacteria bacterium]